MLFGHQCRTASRPRGRVWAAPAKSRRGILLLVVLSLLVVFMMTAVAFVVVSRSFHRSALAVSKVERLDDPAEGLLDGALYDLLRDTQNPHSRVRYHSLLRDMYGDDGLGEGAVHRAALVEGTGGQFLDVAVANPGAMLSPIDNYYNGHVLTITSGPAAGQSTRVVSYVRREPSAGNMPIFRVLAFPPDEHRLSPLVPREGDRFVVNGRPFNGTGVGYDRNGSGHLDVKNGDGQPLALVPNLIFSDPGDNPLWFSAAPGQGGSDEAYDAPDYQNMLLAYVPMNPTIPSTRVPLPNENAYQVLLAGEVDRIVQPSLHRRELVNYWMKRQNHPHEYRWNPPASQVQSDAAARAEALAEAKLARRVVLRPLVADHPKFPRLPSLINGPWDVDNDGDGVPDSIWVDLGYPPVKTPDGRFYKPMFAILVQDLDGRLNLNAHGSREEALSEQGRPETEYDVILASDTGSPRSAMQRPAGQGYGPPEVSLWPLFTVGGKVRADDYIRLVQGGDVFSTRNVVGRYGANRWPGAASDSWDLVAQMKFGEYPPLYAWPAEFAGSAAQQLNAFAMYVRRGFSTPPDLKGRFGVGIDFTGFPNLLGFRAPAIAVGQAGGTMVAESAYEKNLLQAGARSEGIARNAAGQLASSNDALFTEAELERILRPYDADAGQLPDRLLRLLSVFSDPSVTPADRNEILRSVTVRSFDVPVPSVVAPREVQEAQSASGGAGTRPNNIVDLLLARLRQEGTSAPEEQLRVIVRRLLSPDLLDNLPLDINRPLGNRYPMKGADGGSFVGPLRGGNAIAAASAPENDSRRVYRPVPLDLARLKNVDEGTETTDARQLMARHLYVLLMLLKGPDYVFKFNDKAIDGNAQLARRLTALRLAQWAVNAVDFRDADSIMTGFEVDLEPFVDNDGDPSNGTWDVDGDLGANSPDNNQPWRAVVWGMEQPHLLITETLATHDLRVRDSAHDSGGQKRRDAAKEEDRDPHLDQYRVPQGSLFVELFCTGNPTNAVMPGELYTYQQGRWLLDLERTPPNDPNPVWRMAISEPHDEDHSARGRLRQRPETTTFQPERMDLLSSSDSNIKSINIARYVWFASRPPSGRVPESERTFWNLGAADAGAVAAGHYAVVAPRLVTSFGSRVDEDGRRSLAAQRIVLNPGRVHVVDEPGVLLHRSFLPDFDVSRSGNGNVKAVHNMVVGMRKPVPGWERIPEIGLNISEPMPNVDFQTYYAPPRLRLSGYVDQDAYGDDTPANPLPDEPEDLQPNRPVGQLQELFGRTIGTHGNVRTIFLQRLADPTTPWNPPPEDPQHGGFHRPELPVNPYLTVDWQPLDLTVFNGEDRPPADWSGDDGKYIAQGFTGSVEEDVRLSTRERGLQRPGPQYAENIWRGDSENEPRASLSLPPESVPTDAYFRHALRHSLGYLNEIFGQPIEISPGMPARDRALALGAPAARNSPLAKPFPWLVWNDRPYVSQYELLQVPLSAPGRLSVEHSTAAHERSFDTYGTGPLRSAEIYTPGTPPPTRLRRYSNLNATFGHLLNFFASASPDSAAGNGPSFYRLLEYTGVPSRFVGTETFLNPEVFSNRTQASTEERRPPFNRISQYREPGKINLNTLYSEVVYRGLFHGQPTDGGTAHPGPRWSDFLKDRRGYEATDPDHENQMFAFNDGVPTFFAGLYGPPDAGRLVPLTGDEEGEADMRRIGADMGLLRRQKGMQGSNSLFRDHVGFGLPAQDVDKNSYFRYQAIQRLANLTSTRSNVYAVWITVGFFEMEPVPAAQRTAVIASGATPQEGQALFDRLYPEGMWLTTEAGSDRGQTRRYRGFYIIDRTIPVAFEPGANHNVDNAVLLRRRIE